MSFDLGDNMLSRKSVNSLTIDVKMIISTCISGLHLGYSIVNAGEVIWLMTKGNGGHFRPLSGIFMVKGLFKDRRIEFVFPYPPDASLN